MKFVALISGGKDSCFNISHCQKHGHELVAAASLRPKEGIDELDSYLYQTVGQDAIEYVAQALDVPLYRRVIEGSAVEMGNEYGTRAGTRESLDQSVPGDETEDLFYLLQDVIMHHPDIKGVSVGAILSTYQRMRVEHVCRRLGLTSLSYLWQRDQKSLLQEMVDSGVDAVLIKVAGIGLKPIHLGRSLAQMQQILLNLNTRFGSHVCGEGGEYETLTLDCPAFKRRINLVETEVVIQDDKDFATVAYLKIKSATLQTKTIDSDIEVYPPNPPLLDEVGQCIYSIIRTAGIPEPTQEESVSTFQLNTEAPLRHSIHRSGNWIAIGSISSGTEPLVTIEDQTLFSFRLLKETLQEEEMKLENVIHINAFLASMEDFMAFNQVYASYFGTSPPARACVATTMPPSQKVTLDVIACKEIPAKSKTSLHVQGLSYWAPANIGPYSQAVSMMPVTFISGQIGLIPPSMTMPSPLDVGLEVALSFQHIQRIRNALSTSSLSSADILYMGFIAFIQEDQQHLDVDMLKEITETRPPFLFVIPLALPKGASVEIQTILHINPRSILNEEKTGTWTHGKETGTPSQSCGFRTLVSNIEKLSNRLRGELNLGSITTIGVQKILSMIEPEQGYTNTWDLAIVSLHM
ncbi:hypothetical protein CPB86DRAFT_772005 [Serendipita vermifera]|nr:hypothetical protein CPB86DRAFT_772005 [Serendipita vermifera]